MSSKVQQLINEAQEILNHKAYDAAHDIEHHQQVWANAQQIATTLKEKVDLTALEIAAMWHDAVVKKKLLNRNRIKRQTANYVANRMKALGFTTETIIKSKTAILQHSATDIQTIVESKILADADRIEWLNIDRFKKISNEINSGKFKKIKIAIYKYYSKKLFKKIHQGIHFDETQKILAQKIKEFKKNPQIKRIVSNFGENIENFI